MRIHMIACRVLSRELSYLASQSENIVDITWVRQGLHDTPELLRRNLQNTMAELNAYFMADEKGAHVRPDYFALGYGLCSNGVVGIEAGDIPIVVPRTDDCIALLLGSQQRYLELFRQNSGIYWTSSGWLESGLRDRIAEKERKYKAYTELYGEEAAKELVAAEYAWMREYNTYGYIDSPIYKNAAYSKTAKAHARKYGWRFERFKGDARLLTMLVNGDWNEKEFLVCPPHHRIAAAYDGSKIRAVPIES